ncbi:hypothetical protein B0H10DRAFT_1981073 [Mycena sp. CBHHK59/15]|nr:hypothetical protein B0H10DRAFT_1981073 [Mycena sp. CBHHK59/15]
MAPKSGKSLFIEGEVHYEAGRMKEAFDLYYQAITHILAHEDVLVKFPGVPEQFPQEVIAVAWQNLLGIFRQSGSGFNQESSAEAYELVYSFRPTTSARAHPQFKGPQGRHLLKAMQISAGFALGILAWEKGDRSTTAKRYQEALDLAATHPPFNSVTPNLKHLDRIIASEVAEIKDNLAMLIEKDTQTANMVGRGQGDLRKEVLNVPNTRIGDNGGITLQDTFVVATDACGRPGCNKRGAKFKRCSVCKKVAYCGVECQKADWKMHKATHI